MSWPLIPIGELLTDVQPGFASGKTDPDGVLQIRMNNVKPDGSWDWTKKRYVPATKKQVEKYNTKTGDVFFNATNSSEQVGKSALFSGLTGEFVSYSNHFLRLRVNPKKLDPAYLTRYLNHLWSKRVFENMVNAWVNQATVRREDFLNIKIPLPPLETQKQIAVVLEKADQLRKDCQQMEQEINSLAQSVFIDMFGDPVTNPRAYNTEKFKDIGLLARGKSKHRPRNDPALLDGPYPLIQTGDVARAGDYIKHYSSTYSELGLKQSKLWPKGTLCITIAANIADTAILDFDACFPDSVVGFLPDESKVLTEFIYFWLVFYQKVLVEMAPESAQKNINLAILGDLDIFLPPLCEQQKFVDFYKKAGETKEWAGKQYHDLSETFASLMQRAFKGELNLN